MRYVKSVIICLLGSFTALFCIPFAVRQAKYNEQRNAFDFPDWAHWLLTEDAPNLPRDALYEPAIRVVFDKRGAKAAIRRWLYRNLAHNLWQSHGADIPLLDPRSSRYAVTRIGSVDPNDDEPTLGAARYKAIDRRSTKVWELYAVYQLFAWRGRRIGLRLRFGWKLQPLYISPLHPRRIAQLTFHISIRRIGARMVG